MRRALPVGMCAFLAMAIIGSTLVLGAQKKGPFTFYDPVSILQEEGTTLLVYKVKNHSKKDQWVDKMTAILPPESVLVRIRTKGGHLRGRKVVWPDPIIIVAGKTKRYRIVIAYPPPPTPEI